MGFDVRAPTVRIECPLRIALSPYLFGTVTFLR
jgi:hypothetical protein